MRLERPPDMYDGISIAAVYRWVDTKEGQQALKDLTSPHLNWSDVQYRASRYDVDPGLLWRALKMTRAARSRSLPLGDGLHYILTPQLESWLHHIDLYFGGTRDASLQLSDAQRQRLIRSTLFEETFTTSLLEGAVTTRDQAKALIEKGVKPRTEAEQMVLNQYRALEYIVEHRQATIDEAHLLRLHEILTQNALPTEQVGRYRQATDHIVVVDTSDSDVVHRPPPADTLPTRIATLLEWLNDTPTPGLTPIAVKPGGVTYMHPALKAMTAHYMMGYLHPFCDGNGRMGRSLFYWVMLRNGYWLTEYLSISQIVLRSRNAYYRAYLHTQADDHDLTYFLEYHTRAVVLAYNSMLEYVKRRILPDTDQAINLASKHGLTVRQGQLLAWGLERPGRLLTVRDVATRLAIGTIIARRELETLVDRGLARRVPIDGRTYGYVMET